MAMLVVLANSRPGRLPWRIAHEARERTSIPLPNGGPKGTNGMNELIRLATIEIARFLESRLPDLSPQWWDKHVLDRLSFQQQRTAREREFSNLKQLDFAGLLRVLDQNWFELSGSANLSREGRNWVKELQTVRNKWAHLSAESMPDSELYRDADTLGRLLELLRADKTSIDAIEATKACALTEIATYKNLPPTKVSGAQGSAGIDVAAQSSPPLRHYFGRANL